MSFQEGYIETPVLCTRVFAHVFENGTNFTTGMPTRMAVLCTRVREWNKIHHLDAHQENNSVEKSGRAPQIKGHP